MSKVSRSTYQKLAEENKRLLKDIKTLVEGDIISLIKVKSKWKDHFKQERDNDALINEACRLHVLNNMDKYPSFITDKAKEI